MVALGVLIEITRCFSVIKQNSTNAVNLYQVTINYQSALLRMLKFWETTFVETSVYENALSQRCNIHKQAPVASTSYFFNNYVHKYSLNLRQTIVLIQFSAMNSRNNKIWKQKTEVK